MGVYLSSPIRDKISENEESERLRYGASSMQGWRTSQEDAHNCCPHFDTETNTSLFACYDGHGGAEVAQYTAEHFPDFLKNLEAYKGNDLSKALVEAFLSFDETLKEDTVVQKLKELAGVDDDDESEGNQEEPNALYEEATMPLEELLSRYGRGGATVASALKKDQKFQSPVIIARKENGDAKPMMRHDVRLKLENELMNGHSDNENNENIERASQLQAAAPSGMVASSSGPTSSAPTSRPTSVIVLPKKRLTPQANEALAKEDTKPSLDQEGSSCVDSTTSDDITHRETAANEIKAEAHSNLPEPSTAAAEPTAAASSTGEGDVKPVNKPKVSIDSSVNGTDSQPSSTTTSCTVPRQESSSTVGAGGDSTTIEEASPLNAGSSCTVSAGLFSLSAGSSTVNEGSPSTVSAGSSSVIVSAGSSSTTVSAGSSSTPVCAGSSSTPVGAGSSSVIVSAGLSSTTVSAGSSSTTVSAGSSSVIVSAGSSSTTVIAGASTTDSAGSSSTVSAGLSSTTVSAGSSSTVSAGSSTTDSAGSSSTTVSAGSSSTTVSAGSSSTTVSAGSSSTTVSAGSSSTTVSPGSSSTTVSAGSSTTDSAGSSSTTVSPGSSSTTVSPGSSSTTVSAGSSSTTVSPGSSSTTVSPGSSSTTVSAGSSSTTVSAGSSSTTVNAGSSSTTVSAGSSSSQPAQSGAPECSSASPGGSGSSSSGSSSSSTSISEEAGPCSSSKQEPEAGSSTGRTRSKRKSVIPEEGEDESSFDEDSSDDEDDDEDDEGAEPWASGSGDSSDEDAIPCAGEEDDEEEEEEEEDAMGGGEEPGADSGCTSVVALLRGKELYVANAGDSRCVLCRGGKAHDMSVDHKPEDEIEHSRITKAGGRVTMDGRVNGGLNLSRAIGDHCYKRNSTLSDREQMITALPDIMTATLEETDTFMVLACDGIWNVMTSQDVVNFVSERLKGGVTTLSSICEEMFEICLSPDTSGDGTGCDNMTCIIVCFKHADTDTTTVSGTACVKRLAESTDKTDLPDSKRARTEASS